MRICFECGHEYPGDESMCTHCQELHRQWADEDYEYWSAMSLAFGDWVYGCGEPMVPAGSMKEDK